MYLSIDFLQRLPPHLPNILLTSIFLYFILLYFHPFLLRDQKLNHFWVLIIQHLSLLHHFSPSLFHFVQVFKCYMGELHVYLLWDLHDNYLDHLMKKVWVPDNDLKYPFNHLHNLEQLLVLLLQFLLLFFIHLILPINPLFLLHLPLLLLKGQLLYDLVQYRVKEILVD